MSGILFPLYQPFSPDSYLHGINPDEKVGYDLYEMKPGKETVIKKLLDMHQARDKKAAHGKTNELRNIGYCELKDKQALARYLIASHIETKLKAD